MPDDDTGTTAVEEPLTCARMRVPDLTGITGGMRGAMGQNLLPGLCSGAFFGLLEVAAGLSAGLRDGDRYW